MATLSRRFWKTAYVGPRKLSIHQSPDAGMSNPKPSSGGMSYTPYPAYKASGTGWLGEIPAHWEVKRLKSFAKNVAGKAHTIEERDVYIALEHIQSWTGKVSPSQCEGALDQQVKRFHVGDILFGKLRPYLAKVARPEQGGICSSELLVLRPMTDVCGAFLEQIFLSKDVIDLIDSSTFGAKMPRAEWEFIGKIHIAFPPDLVEQKAIATFLDRETAKIDTLIEKQEQLIDLLQEKRIALISHAVTKGLDPNVPMKDSGIGWLGEIPAHWEVKRLKRLLTEPLKYGANEPADCANPDFPRYIRITDIQENGTLRDNSFRSIPENLAYPYLLAPDDILFARSGSIGMTFRYDPSWGRAAFAGYLIRARLNEKIEPAFLEYFTQSRAYKLWLFSSCIQTTIQNVSAERYANINIPIPPNREQREITAFLDCETEKIDTLISKTYQAIELLKESRSALITAAVTGKMDVRQASIPSA